MVMSSTEGEEEDNRLLSTAQRIINSLRTSKDVTDDMLLILSSFDNRLSNISTLTAGNEISGEMSRLDSAEKVIRRHSNSSSHLFDVDSSVNDSCEFLTAVDQILDLISDDRKNVQSNVKFMARAQSAIQSAMSKLEDEFRRLLCRSSGELDVNRHPGTMHRVSLSVIPAGDDLISEEFGNFNNLCFHERRGSIAGGDVAGDLVNPEMISDLREIASRMIRARYEKECCQVYVTGRREVLEEYLVNLGFERLGIEEVHRIEWNDLDEKMKRWIHALKIVIRVILTREKRLCEQIFDGSKSIREVCFVEATQACIMQLLNFGEAVSIAKRSPEKLFRILDMYETLNGSLPGLKALFSNDLGEFVPIEAKGVLEGLGEAARGTFAELEIAVKGESSRKPVIGGGIHPLARYVMNYVKLIVDYSETLNFLLESNVKESGNAAQNGVNGDELGENSSLGRRLMSLISSLESNLEEKAKFYENKGMQYVFLMNNKLYILQKVKDSELDKLLEDGWVKRRRGIIRKYSMSYLRASWTKVLDCLRDDGIKGLLHNALKMGIKERLKNFNASFEEVYRIQTAWKVPDSQLRAELRISISEKLIPAYRSFLGRFGSQLESERHAGKYIKYTTEDLDAYLADLFEARPVVLHHVRRKSTV